MKINPDKIKDFLVGAGFVSEEDFESAKQETEKSGRSIQDILVERELVADEDLGRLIAEDMGANFINLRKEAISEEIIKIIPELVAKNQEIIAFGKTEEGLKVAMTDPGNLEIIEWLERKTGERLIVFYATSLDVKGALKHYRKELKMAFEDIIKEQVERAKDISVKSEAVPIIKLVDTLIEYAYENRSSDIHIEPLSDKTLIRFRIDGVLHNVLTLPKKIHGFIVTRIKVLSQLRTDEHFTAQDGKFTVKTDEARFDIRVSVVPVSEGENIVMRILSEKARQFDLESLGLAGESLKRVKNAIKKPYGMILSTGPTGSGKTTTLYAILKILNKPAINICTIEDPVEYDIEGVSQIQVNSKTGLTFARGLRSIVRQDPDIIMVGEVRDDETAAIAVNSAMTGHLVLSTMHANTAATNIPRLTDMGVEPFLVASSVNIIIAQRLLRKICVKCRASREIGPAELKEIGFSEPLIKKILKGKDKAMVYRGDGCKSCAHTGYSGRIGIFEILEMNEEIRKLVLMKSAADDIQEQAVKDGMALMIEDAIEKVLAGLTTIKEIIRVIRK